MYAATTPVVAPKVVPKAKPKVVPPTRTQPQKFVAPTTKAVAPAPQAVIKVSIGGHHADGKNKNKGVKDKGSKGQSKDSKSKGHSKSKGKKGGGKSGKKGFKGK